LRDPPNGIHGFLGAFLDGLYLVAEILGRIPGLLGEFLNFIGDNRKPFARSARRAASMVFLVISF